MDRVESYTYDADGRLTRTRFDDDADGVYDRYAVHLDGAPDIVSSYRRDGNGLIIGIDTDDDEDGATDSSVVVERDASGYRFQASAVSAGVTTSISYYNDLGERLAVGLDRTDADRVLDSFLYASALDVTSEIRASVATPAVGLVDANDLVGVPLVQLAGPDVGSTDLTISVEALAVLAGGDAEYQLRIDGDREDALRFDMSDFTERDAVDVDGEAYRQFAGATGGSFIVDPDVTLFDI